MGQVVVKVRELTGGVARAESIGPRSASYDPDEKWSNLYREREKNHLYKWVGARSGGDLITIYEKEGEDGVLRFAVDKLEPMMYENGKSPQLIKYADYMKWKKTVMSLQNVELGVADENGHVGSKFREHVAQWRLNKRGVDGETIIHLLLNREEPFCSEIARILITKYPGLAKDLYMGDEMFGQSALHLAIVHDDYDTVQLLLSAGADVNARASGDFFLPEDHKNTKSPNYQGYAYYGEYPLAFAACFGNKDIYDLLLQYGADPDMQDMFGNTILHMCVINYSNAMYSYAVRHWHKPARTDVVNQAGYTPLTLATKLGRKQIFEEMLELMKVEFWRFSDMTCSAYPLTTLDTIRSDGTTNYDSVLMTVINGRTPEHLDMIASEVIQRLLEDKWKLYAKRKLFLRLGLLILHLIFLCFVVFTRPTQTVRLYMIQPEWDDYMRCVFECLTILSALYFVFGQQVDELKTQGFYGYLKNLQTAPAKIIFLVANVCILACVPCRLTQSLLFEEALLVFALPGSWMFFLFFARSYKLTGPFVQMIYSMIAGDMIRFAIISAIFLVSFSQVFFFVGKDMALKQHLPADNPNHCPISGYPIYTYSTFLETFVTLFRASMGGYDYEEFSCTNYEPLTKTLFVFYMFIMPIMMINILIAMMGNTYTTIITQAEKAWRQQYAQIVMVLERSVDRQKLISSQLEYSIKLQDQDARGLMVIKQTKKTRARQRRQAITNWKNMARKVMNLINKLGTDAVKVALHSHDKLYEDMTLMKSFRSPTFIDHNRSSFTHSSHDVEPSVEQKLESALVIMEAAKRTSLVTLPTPNSLHPNQIPPQNPTSETGPKIFTTERSARIEIQQLQVPQHQTAVTMPLTPVPIEIPTTSGTLSRPGTDASIGQFSTRSAHKLQKNSVSQLSLPPVKIRGLELTPSNEVPNLPDVDAMDSQWETIHQSDQSDILRRKSVSPIPITLPMNAVNTPPEESPMSGRSSSAKHLPTNGYVLTDEQRASQHIFRATDATPPPRAVSPRFRSDLFRRNDGAPPTPKRA